MSLKKINILVVILLCGHLCNAQVTTFDTTFHNAVDLIFTVLPEGNEYLTVMGSYVFPQGQFIIYKLDSNGNIINSKQYGQPDEHYFIQSLIKTSDSLFVTGCYVRDNNTGKRQAVIVKFDINGDTLWSSKWMPPTGWNYNSQYLIETSDKGFLITGQLVDSLISDGEFFILKMDSLGNYEWESVFGGPNFDCAFSSIETPDKGFLTLGWTGSFGFGNANNRDILLVKWDSLGNYQWYKTYGTTESEGGIGIVECSDGNYLLSCYRYNQFTNSSTGKVIKVDGLGNLIWQQDYNSNRSEFWWARERSNYEIIAIGSERNSNIKDDGFIVCTDSSGNEKWRRLYRVGTNHCYFRDVQETPDGGIICAGFVFQGASGGQDGWLVKLDSTGCLSAGNCGVPTGLFDAPSVTGYDMSIYPNPVKDQSVIKIDGLPPRLMNESYRLRVYDLQGRLVQSPETGFLVANTWIQCIFKRGALNSGVYLLEVSTYTNERLGMVKVVVE